MSHLTAPAALEALIRTALPDLPWQRDGKNEWKWFLGRMEGWSKGGLHEVNFDIERKGRAGSHTYRLTLGYGQGDEVATAREATYAAHPLLRPIGTTGAWGWEDPSAARVIELARRVVETFRSGCLTRDGGTPSGRRLVEGWYEARAATLLALPGGDREAFNENYRNLLGDTRDDLISVGRSLAARRAGPGAELRREHLVPLALLRDEVWRLRCCGIGANRLALFLMHHARVLVITRAEQERLDRAPPVGMGWSDRMPPGWDWWGDVMARIDGAGIEWDDGSPGAPPRRGSGERPAEGPDGRPADPPVAPRPAGPGPALPTLIGLCGLLAGGWGGAQWARSTGGEAMAAMGVPIAVDIASDPALLASQCAAWHGDATEQRARADRLEATLRAIAPLRSAQ